MKNKTTTVLLSVIVLLVGWIGYTSVFQKTKIAYVDSAKLVEKSTAMQKLQTELRADAEKNKANIDTLVMEFENSMKSYEKKMSSMSVKEKELATELLKNKQSQLVQYQQAIKQKVGQQEQQKMQEVLKVINQTISDYGKQQGYQIIFATSNGNIAYADEAIDITEDIIERINN